MKTVDIYTLAGNETKPSFWKGEIMSALTNSQKNALMGKNVRVFNSQQSMIIRGTIFGRGEKYATVRDSERHWIKYLFEWNAVALAVKEDVLLHA